MRLRPISFMRYTLNLTSRKQSTKCIFEFSQIIHANSGLIILTPPQMLNAELTGFAGAIFMTSGIGNTALRFE